MLSEAEKRAVKLAYLIWKSIDFDGMKRSRLMGIWDEFREKLQFAAQNGEGRFLTVFCRRMGIGVPKYPELIVLIDKDTMKVLRENSILIVTVLRKMIEVEKEKIRTTEEKKAMREYIDSLIAEMEKEFDELLKGREKA